MHFTHQKYTQDQFVECLRLLQMRQVGRHGLDFLLVAQ